MALIRSLNTAVAGLKSQQFRIEVVGNNIANVDTTAFKGSRVDFSTILSQTLSFGVAPQGFLGGIDPVQIGHGTQVANTLANFNQGPTENTGVNTDLAIQGNGFFVMTDGTGAQVYTRDGSFTINPSNLLHDPANGFLVRGYAADENFQVNPGGTLSALEIPVGTMTIARPTTQAMFDGNLNADGDLAEDGTQLLSDRLYDSRFTNQDLISAENPLGLARATADTPLVNLMRSLGDFISYDGTSAGSAAQSALVFEELASQLTGTEIQVSGLKGDRNVSPATFTVGDPPPTGGSTLGDFMEFLESNFGINDGTFDGAEQTEHMYSYQRSVSHTGERVNGELALGQLGAADDSATLTSITDQGKDFHEVRAGDFIRFTSGAASGQVAEVSQVTSSVVGGPLDTLVFRSDGFNTLSVVPTIGNTSYTIHAAAGVAIAQDTVKAEIDQSLPSVSVTAPSSLAGSSIMDFVISDTNVTDWGLEQGLAVNQRVDYMSGGVPVSGWITNVTGDSFTVSFSDALTQPPDGSTTFSIVEQAKGSVEMAGNVGTVNGLSQVELTSGGSRVVMFDNPPVINASGESVSFTTTAFDSLGTPRQIQLSFVYEGSNANGPNTWRYFAESADDSDGDKVVGSGTVLFGSNGQFLTTGKPTETLSINLEPDALNPGGAVTPFTFEVDLSRLTSFATTQSQVNMFDQDGFESGVLRDFAVDNVGLITGVFSNGLTRTLGQVALANFANPNGMFTEGGNIYTAAPNSGIPQIGTPGSFGRGQVLSGFLEESNVDLAQQFTDLIIGQRAFQANARTITVSDEMLQELVNLI